MRCVVCGREIETGSLCGKCMVEKEEVAKIDEFEITVCSRCNLIRLGNRWVERSVEEVIEEMVLRNARVVEEFNVTEVAISQEHCVFRGEISGDEVKILVPLKYRINKVLCEKCSREAGGYYESIVQLRAAGRELSDEEIEKALEIVDEVISSAPEDQKAFISKLERKREGVNIFFGSRNIGKKVSRMIMKKLGGSITESKKLHTRIDGRDVYRFTYSVKLPEYREGDIVEKEGRFAVVRNSVAGKGLDILTGKTVNLGNERVAVRREDLKSGVVVNADPNAVEVVCEDGRLVTTPKPSGAEIGAEVKVFEINGKFFSVYEGGQSSEE
ncbi:MULTISPECIES: 60S ribosomal export protein NMD3 [Archaeoglobus]|uniref:60S ribosomal export protein NMD3 n=1 Tax=Archaeoglobus TaxID=2233 RepID=UPI0013052B8F|nr:MULTISPECIES: 60S ribosomal export protein NMD3 [Archaeoglobus]